MHSAPTTSSQRQAQVHSFLPLLRDMSPWSCALECVQGSNRPIDLSAYLSEIATKRHRLYVIACTLQHDRQHLHLRIAGVLPARNKMLDAFCPIDPPVYRLVQVPCAFRLAYAKPQDGTVVHPLFARGRRPTSHFKWYSAIRRHGL